MRELPEPDYYACNQYGPDDMYPPVAYCVDTVAAIQKKAYEDGLRDAIPEGYVLSPVEPTDATAFAADEHCSAGTAKRCY
ncbi:MAG: hypothetical protein WC829_03105 [Hyphomicrobium sp.]|jgi:hypothetical protein